MHEEVFNVCLTNTCTYCYASVTVCVLKHDFTTVLHFVMFASQF